MFLRAVGTRAQTHTTICDECLSACASLTRSDACVLIKLAWAVVALESLVGLLSANPAINSTVSGSIAGPAAATTQMVAGQAQVRIDGTGLTAAI